MIWWWYFLWVWLPTYTHKTKQGKKSLWFNIVSIDPGNGFPEIFMVFQSTGEVNCGKDSPSLKLTANAPKNQWLQNDISSWHGLFSGIMLVSRRIQWKVRPGLFHGSHAHGTSLNRKVFVHEWLSILLEEHQTVHPFEKETVFGFQLFVLQQVFVQSLKLTARTCQKAGPQKEITLHLPNPVIQGAMLPFLPWSWFSGKPTLNERKLILEIHPHFPLNHDYGTVDGRNPAPVDMVNIHKYPIIYRVYTSQVVVWDFFHQQEEG